MANGNLFDYFTQLEQQQRLANQPQIGRPRRPRLVPLSMSDVPLPPNPFQTPPTEPGQTTDRMVLTNPTFPVNPAPIEQGRMRQDASPDVINRGVGIGSGIAGAIPALPAEDARPRLSPPPPLNVESGERPVLTPLEQTEAEMYRRQQMDWKTKVKGDGAGDNDHNWWDVVKNIGLGFAQGGIPGAIGGGIAGAIDPNTDEKYVNRIRLGGLEEQHAAQSKMADENLARTHKQAQIDTIPIDDEHRKTALEIQKENAANRKLTSERNSTLRQLGLMKRYKHGESPDFDTKLESLGIEQPDFEPDKKIKPRYWEPSTGKLMTFDEYGATIPVTRPDGTEIIAGSRKEVESGGYTVMPGTARMADAQVEGSQVTATNETLKNEREYKITIAKLDSKIASSNARISSIKNSLSALENLTGIEKLKSADQKTQLQKELREEEAEFAGYKREKELTPKPVEVQGRTGLNVGNYSEQQFRQIFKDKTPQQLEILVKNAKAQGIIK